MESDPAVTGWADRVGPSVEALRRAHEAGRVARDLRDLAWSLAHLQCNRLGIPGDGEAVLHYFLQRLHEDGRGSTP